MMQAETANLSIGGLRSPYAGLLNGVLEGVSQDGKRCYLAPPIPTGTAQQLTVVFDYIAYPELMDARQPRRIPGSSRDTTAVIARNLQENRMLGPMRDWKELWGAEAGKTCLMICAGPSLTESLPELTVERERDDVFTMGFNRSHRLMDLDYFVLVDRVAQPDWIARSPGATKLIAATTGACHIAAAFEKRWWGEHFLDGTDEGLTRLHAGLSLTLCDAMYAAYRLGATCIKLYGCDFGISGHLAAEEKTEKRYWHLDKYYADQRSHVGTDSRRASFPESWPAIGINGKVVFVNHQMWANAAYTTVMCLMLYYAGIEVVNESRAGILFWGGFNGPQAE
jgi:hypothetical protein